MCDERLCDTIVKRNIMPNNIKNQRPVTFVVFGASGDLARTKLIPAIFDLTIKNKLPEKYSIIGFGRREWTDTEFRNFVYEILAKNKSSAPDKFLNSLRYIKGDFTSVNDYKHVAKAISEIDKGREICADRLLYLAAPPEFYKSILNGIDKSGLGIPCGGEKGWARILIEKPFGTDSKMAEGLETLLSKLFKEEQIFRIDHYLAKETIQIFCFQIRFLSRRGIESLLNPFTFFSLKKKEWGDEGHFMTDLGLCAMSGKTTCFKCSL